ncbi:RNA polymerase sigma factor [Nonomuraea antri]|uniref:RNA polymerase sigma factor n=1 Tax=Nonomuraea antri TaxID=2730852 RepID=UPI002E2874A5|nr:RNA polymerase sigma factor [Nonomuraea antri]
MSALWDVSDPPPRADPTPRADLPPRADLSPRPDSPPRAEAGAREAEDARLIEESLSTPERFAALYDRYSPEIHRYVAGRLGTQAADDLTAEIFLAAFHGRAGFDGRRGIVRGWLYGIATHQVAQHRKSESRLLRTLQRAPLAGEAESGHEDLVAGRVVAASMRGRLAAALAAIPDADRDVLVLVALAGLGYEEIAQALDIPAGTVGSRLNRARKKLRAALGGVNPMFGDADG